LENVVIFLKHGEVTHGTLQKLHLARHRCAGDILRVKASSTFLSQGCVVSDNLG